MEWKQLNRQVIDEFRSSGGRVAQFGDLPVVILHTVGACSGRTLEVPLIVVVEEDGTMLLFATAAGASKQPPWVFNLRANPEIDIEMGSETFRAYVRELPTAQAQQRRDIQAQRSKQFQSYLDSAAPRVVPVFEIERS